MAIEAVARPIDDESGFAEPLSQILTGLDFVLDKQQFHQSPPTRRRLAAVLLFLNFSRSTPTAN
jgi:hypothetical protein